jgi:C-1 hydroxylase
MSLEENKAIVRCLFEALNEQNLSLLDEIIAPDYVEHTLELKGLESMKQYMTLFWKGFPDLHVTIEDIIAEGDKVWVRVKITGTHIGEYRGIAPSGKKTAFSGVDICRIVDGKVIEAESVNDFLNFFKQLGVIDYKGFPDEKVS